LHLNVLLQNVVFVSRLSFQHVFQAFLDRSFVLRRGHTVRRPTWLRRTRVPYNACSTTL